jgi:hypothetical protein
MEDSKLQALHDSLNKLRGHQGLGSNTQYSWQKKGKGEEAERGPRTDGLPTNALYSNFLPSGTYDPAAVATHDGDGRRIKRDFSDIAGANKDESDDDSDESSSDSDSSGSDEKLTPKERKAAKKAALKEAKIKEGGQTTETSRFGHYRIYVAGRGIE